MLNLVKQSVTVIFELPDSIQEAVVSAYIESLNYAFLVIVPACAFASFFGLFVKNLNLRGDLGAPTNEANLEPERSASKIDEI